MRVLIAHNRYQQPGGEDQVVEAEAALMAAAGWEIERLEVHNDAVSGMAPIEAAARAVWNPASHRQMRALCTSFRPDIVHVHNSLPLLSPAVFRAAASAGAGVVMTLHNYRLICPGALLLRDGRPCEDCVGSRIALPAIRHKCYRRNRGATATVAATTLAHHLLGTWQSSIDRYIALTEFARRRFLGGGLPPARVVVKPNFLSEDPPVGHGGGGALFVGRLSPEKGLSVLLEAWKALPDVPLRIIGDGPRASEVQTAAKSLPHVEWLGHQPRAEVDAALRAADMLVVPSLWYEGMPMTIIEGLAAGTPIIASDIGGLPEMVEDGREGRLFSSGSAEALAAAVRSLTSDAATLRAMRVAARRTYEQRYTARANLAHLTRIYAEAQQSRPTTIGG